MTAVAYGQVDQPIRLTPFSSRQSTSPAQKRDSRAAPPPKRDPHKLLSKSNTTQRLATATKELQTLDVQPSSGTNNLGLATGAIDTCDRFGDKSMSYADQGSSSATAAEFRSGHSPAFSRRVRRGQKFEDLQAGTQQSISLNSIDSPFQLQEYLAVLIRCDPHDVEAIVRLPQTFVASTDAFNGDTKGKGKEEGSADVFMGNGGDEEAQLVDTDVWVFEQLRKIVADFTSPWLTSLQRECDRKQKPKSCEAMNADDWMYLCASHGEEKQCCAIDYVIHTLDGTTALLNSHRHFPSRTYIPTTSLRHFGSVSRRLSRIFVHAFEHHRDTFEACEAETSLYARFIALVRAYDLISIDSLPRLGEKAADGKAEASKEGGQRNEDYATAEATDGFVGRARTAPVGRQLFDNEACLSSKVPTDEIESEEDEELDVGEDKLDESVSARLHRSDSNASRVTAIHLDEGTSD